MNDLIKMMKDRLFNLAEGGFIEQKPVMVYYNDDQLKKLQEFYGKNAFIYVKSDRLQDKE